MTKNMTRKGLALGAAISLGISALVAAPAVAAPSITVTPDKGTSYSFISGEQFDLRVFGNTEFGTGFGDLKWQITNSSLVAVTSVTTAGTGTAASVSPTGGSATASTASIVVTPAAIATATGANKLGLSVPADKTATLKVLAFIDVNGSGAYEAAFDLAAAEQTVSFIQAKDVVANLSITQPIQGDTTVEAEFTLNVNNEQLDETDFAIYFTTGTDTDLAGGAFADVVVGPGALSATQTTFAAETGALTALAKDTAVKAQVVYNDGGIGGSTLPVDFAASTGNVKVGAAATSTVVTRTITGAEASVVRSATAIEASTSSFHVSRNKAFEVQVTVENDTTTPAKPVAGVAVTMKIESTPTLSATAGSVKSVTVGGVTYTDKTLLPGVTAGKTARLTATTDADGVAKLGISTAGFAVGEELVVTFFAENFSDSVTVMSVDPAYTAKLADARDGVSTVDGSAAALKVLVRDQFNGLPDNGVYDVTAAFVSSAQTTPATAASSVAAAVVNGEATLSILDNGTGTGTNKYTLNLATKSVTAGYSATVAFEPDFEVRIVTEAARTAGAVTVTTGGGTGITQNATTKLYTAVISTTDADLNLNTLAAHDARTSIVAAPTLGATGAPIAGTVTTLGTATSAAATIAGTPVTISGAGLMFRTVIGGVDVFGVDSLTTMTDKAGAYTFEVFSNNAGKQTVTITAGSGSASVVLDAFDQAATNSATSFVIDAPASAAPGSTVQVTATLTDKYGNPVTVSGAADSTNPGVVVAYTGPGLLVGNGVGAITQATNADGKVSFSVLLGANDSGTASVTVTYNKAGTNTPAADKITSTKTIIIGAASGNVGDYSSWTKKLDDSSAKIYAKNVVGAGKVQFFLNGREIAWVRATSAADAKLLSASGANYMVRTVTFAAGKNVLEVYVDGVRTTRTAYTKR